MSAESCLAFYGIRFEVGADEIEPLELERDQRMVLARKHGLDHYWGNFGAPGDRYLLFVGRKIGVLGAEYADELSIGREALVCLMDETAAKVKGAGFQGAPCLWIQREPDA